MFTATANAAGQGVTFIPKSVQALIGTEVVCKPLEPCAIQMEFAAAWRQNDNSPVLEAFLAIARSQQVSAAFGTRSLASKTQPFWHKFCPNDRG